MQKPLRVSALLSVLVLGMCVGVFGSVRWSEQKCEKPNQPEQQNQTADKIKADQQAPEAKNDGQPQNGEEQSNRLSIRSSVNGVIASVRCLGNKFDKFSDAVSAISTAVIALLTLVLMLATIGLHRSTKKLWVEAKASGETARDTLIATNRAWIEITKIEILNGQISLKKDRGFAGITIHMKNVGTAPATNVAPYVKLTPFIGSPDSIMQAHHSWCAEAKSKPFAVGMTIFPGSAVPNEIFNYNAFEAEISGDRIEDGRLASDDQNSVDLYLIGCVDYAVVSDPGVHHQTGFVYKLRRGTGDTIRPNRVYDQIGLDLPEFGGGFHAT